MTGKVNRYDPTERKRCVMANERPTFTDPTTGAEIENTRLARGICKLLWGLLIGLGALLGCRLLVGLGEGSWRGLTLALGGGLGLWLAIGEALQGTTADVRFRQVSPWVGLEGGLLCGLGGGVVGGRGTGLEVGLLYGLAFGLVALLVGRLGLAAPHVPLKSGEKSLHHAIARLQHRRQEQKRLQAQWAHVPAGALSRAAPPRDPQPTSTALSRADAPAEAHTRLRAAVDEAENPSSMAAECLSTCRFRPHPDG
jgi:hypothetical protein